MPLTFGDAVEGLSANLRAERGNVSFRGEALDVAAHRRQLGGNRERRVRLGLHGFEQRVVPSNRRLLVLPSPVVQSLQALAYDEVLVAHLRGEGPDGRGDVVDRRGERRRREIVIFVVEPAVGAALRLGHLLASIRKPSPVNTNSDPQRSQRAFPSNSTAPST